MLTRKCSHPKIISIQFLNFDSFTTFCRRKHWIEFMPEYSLWKFRLVARSQSRIFACWVISWLRLEVTSHNEFWSLFCLKIYWSEYKIGFEWWSVVIVFDVDGHKWVVAKWMIQRSAHIFIVTDQWHASPQWFEYKFQYPSIFFAWLISESATKYKPWS